MTEKDEIKEELAKRSKGTLIDGRCNHCNTQLKMMWSSIGQYLTCESTQYKDRCTQYYIEQQHRN